MKLIRKLFSPSPNQLTPDKEKRPLSRTRITPPRSERPHTLLSSSHLFLSRRTRGRPVQSFSLQLPLRFYGYSARAARTSEATRREYPPASNKDFLNRGPRHLSLQTTQPSLQFFFGFCRSLRDRKPWKEGRHKGLIALSIDRLRHKALLSWITIFILRPIRSIFFSFWKASDIVYIGPRCARQSRFSSCSAHLWL